MGNLKLRNVIQVATEAFVATSLGQWPIATYFHLQEWNLSFCTLRQKLTRYILQNFADFDSCVCSMKSTQNRKGEIFYQQGSRLVEPLPPVLHYLFWSSMLMKLPSFFLLVDSNCSEENFAVVPFAPSGRTPAKPSTGRISREQTVGWASLFFFFKNS